MATNPIGPTGPRGSDDTLEEPVTTKSGAAAQKAKEGVGPNAPNDALENPTQPAEGIGPTGPRNP
jgi:hypothetical protein